MDRYLLPILSLLLIHATCSKVRHEKGHGSGRRRQGIHPKSTSLQESVSIVDEFDGRNNGPPLDLNNKLKKVKHKGQKPAKQPSEVKVRKGRLVTRSHHLLKVSGLNVTSSIKSEDAGTLLELKTVGRNLVTIKGVESDEYVCMNSNNGEVFASSSANKDCIFREHLEENFHSTFQLESEKSPWFIAINSDGQFILKETKKLDFSAFFQLIS